MIKSLEPVRLVSFDLNGTLIEENSWYDLNIALGVAPQYDEQLYREHELGKLPYPEWIKKLSIEYQKNDDLSRQRIERVLFSYTYRNSGRELVEYLKGKGYTVGIVSGSMDILVRRIQAELGLDFAHATNTFVFDESDRLADIRVRGEEGPAKLEMLNEARSRFGVPLEACAAVGDSDNDIEIFKATGRGIGFRGSATEPYAWRVIDGLGDLRSFL